MIRRRPAVAAKDVPLAYRFLVRLYPRAFRQRFGDEMLRAVAEMRRAHAATGFRRRLALTRHLVGDLVTSLAREHADAFLARLPGPSTAVEPTRPVTNGDRMSTLIQDIRYALRGLRRAPAYSLTVILSLALGIGANALIYSLVDGAVLHPFPYPQPDRLVAVGVRYQDDAQRRFIESISPAEYEDIRAGSQTLERFFAFDLGNRNLSGGDYAERAYTALVWGDPFTTIGIRPLLGRGFTMDETTTSGSNLAIISHRVWQSRFGSDSGLVGRAIRVNGEPRTVVGIMPPSLLLLGTDLWIPMGVSPSVIPRQARQFAVIARVRDGATSESVSSDLATIAGRVARTFEGQFPEYRGWSLAASPWGDVIATNLRPAGLVMLGAVAFVLLLACANVASVVLARASIRQREIALRHALGARTGRLARQLLTESILLAFAGALVGIAAAALLIGPSTALLPAQTRSLGITPSLNARVLLVALAATLAVGLLTSLAPVWQVLRRRATLGLAASGRVLTGSRSDRRLRQAFTIVQIAVAVVLLTGATVMVRSMGQLRAVDPGFDTSHLLTMRLSLARERYPRAQIGTFFESLAERVKAVPGVVSAAAATQFPPANRFDASAVTDDAAAAPSGTSNTVDVTNASEGFVTTLGLRLIGGRTFGAQDADSAPRVAIINEAVVRRFFAGRNPVGRRLGLVSGKDTLWHEVVGIVSNARNRGLDAPPSPEVFVPVRQQAVGWNNQLFLLIRTTVDPTTIIASVREVVRAVDPEQPVYAIQTVEGAIADTIASRRAAALLLAIFGAMALFLAAVGIYGILSYLVSMRTHEIGIRRALGAAERSVVGLVLRETAILVVAGVALGSIGVIAVRDSIGRIAFQTGAGDPSTLATSLLLLAATGIAACLVPVLRAMRVAPIEALRTEGS